MSLCVALVCGFGEGGAKKKNKPKKVSFCLFRSVDCCGHGEERKYNIHRF